MLGLLIRGRAAGSFLGENTVDTMSCRFEGEAFYVMNGNRLCLGRKHTCSPLPDTVSSHNDVW